MVRALKGGRHDSESARKVGIVAEFEDERHSKMVTETQWY